MSAALISSQCVSGGIAINARKTTTTSSAMAVQGIKPSHSLSSTRSISSTAQLAMRKVAIAPRVASVGAVSVRSEISYIMIKPDGKHTTCTRQVPIYRCPLILITNNIRGPSIPYPSGQWCFFPDRLARTAQQKNALIYLSILGAYYG